MIRNFVVTRFSMRIADWHTRAYGDESNREAWFQYRADLFNAGLLQCLARQKKLPTKVWLLMDQTDVACFDRYIDQTHAFIAPMFETPDRPAAQAVQQDLLKFGKGDISVSRIDSDDLICNTYFEDINRDIRNALDANKDFDYVQVPNGFRTDYVRIQKMRFEAGPFLTRRFSNYDGQAIFQFPHGEIANHKSILSERATWIQVLHGSNIKNGFTSRTRLAARNWPKGFVRPQFAPSAQGIIHRAIAAGKELFAKTIGSKV